MTDNAEDYIEFVGWCYEMENGRVTHDKIWGIVSNNGELFTFWGRRDKALTFKRAADYDDVHKVRNQKISKGYNPTTLDALSEDSETFRDKFETALFYAILGDNFHKRETECEA
jgi:hypothetical protein